MSRLEKALIVPSRSMRSTLIWRGGLAAICRRGAVRCGCDALGQVGGNSVDHSCAEHAYGPTSRISRSEADSLEVAVIDVAFQVGLSRSKLDCCL